MGEVYLAEDKQLNRKVAIKFLPAQSIRDEQARKRLIREAQAAAKLDHPNICAIYEVGEADGQSFIVMQYVEGETLSSRIQRKPLEIRETLDIAVQVADALAEAHARGVIHRDIKPQNIMITPRDQVKVLDFGLAKVVQQSPSTQSQAETESLLTGPGMILGTVPYMSPEQVKGELLDSRSDIFSFGAVLYEMISGIQPFAGKNAAVTISAILTQEPLSLARYDTDAPEELQSIACKCLKKDREQRYQSTQELLGDLKSLMFHRSKEQTAAKPPPSIAVLPFVNMSADPENEFFCDGLAEELINALTKIEHLGVAARTSAFSFKGKEVDVRDIGRKLNVNTVLEGSVRKAGNKLRITAQLINVADGYHLWSERYDRQMEDVFEIQDEITLAIVDALKVRMLGKERAALLKRYTDNTEAYQLYLKGRYYWNKWTAEGIKKGIEYFNQAIEIEPGYALAYAGLADCYATQGAGDALALPPKEAFSKAKASAMKALAIDDTLAEAHISLGLVKLNYEWDWLGAEREFKRAIELNSNYAAAYHWYSHYLIVMERTEESFVISKRALEIDPLDLEINAHLAWHYYFARQYDQAIEQCLNTLEMNPNFHEAHWFLGWAYEEKLMYEEAVTEFQKAVALSGGSVQMIAELGHAYAVSGKKDDAQKALDELKELSKRRYVTPYTIALIYVGLGEKDQALEWLESAYEDRDVWLIYLKVEPKFDSLRSEPLFTDLMRRVGLVQGKN